MRVVSADTDFLPLCGPEVTIHSDPERLITSVVAQGALDWAAGDPARPGGWTVSIVDAPGDHNAWTGRRLELWVPDGYAVVITCTRCHGTGMEPELADVNCYRCDSSTDDDYATQEGTHP